MDGLIDCWALTTLTFWLAIILYYLGNVNRRRRHQKFLDGDNFGQKLVQKIIPSPPRLPIIGHLHLLNGEPFVQMTKLGKEYGDIYQLQLGSVSSVVVNSLSLIKEVLVEKGSDFGDRPNFHRYHVLFGNDKENSLAFCNWSQVQKIRRALARRFCHSGLFSDRVDFALNKTSDWMITSLNRDMESPNFRFQLKETINKACANVFFGFFSSQYFEDENDVEFLTVVRTFDKIFWEINQNHPTDVLPFLKPFFKGHLNQLAGMGKLIRAFVVDRIIEPHLKNLDKDNPEDFVDILLTHLVEGDPETKLTMVQVLYELEDFLGGHSAVANLLTRILIEIASVEGLSQKIYNKCILEKNRAYMQALIYETLRKASSPIVPHVASVDTHISGYKIKKGTMILFNNFEMNTSPNFWREPEKFIPERFLSESGCFRKPAHFLPFSSGKRACMGYRLVEKITEGLLNTIIQHFDLSSLDTPNILPRSCVALDPQIDMKIRLVPRNCNA